jgi:hypothetical protein
MEFISSTSEDILIIIFICNVKTNMKHIRDEQKMTHLNTLLHQRTELKVYPHQCVALKMSKLNLESTN